MATAGFRYELPITLEWMGESNFCGNNGAPPRISVSDSNNASSHEIGASLCRVLQLYSIPTFLASL